jgi:hypothetical protein
MEERAHDKLPLRNKPLEYIIDNLTKSREERDKKLAESINNLSNERDKRYKELMNMLNQK